MSCESPTNVSTSLQGTEATGTVTTPQTNNREICVKSLKLSFNDEVRRIKMFQHKNFKKLDQLVRKTFSFDNDTPVFLHYVDEEEEFVRITSRPEWEECIENAMVRQIQTLRIEVSLEDDLKAEQVDTDELTESDSGDASGENEDLDVRVNMRKAFKAVEKTVNQSVKALQKEIKKGKKSKFRAKIKQSIKKMKSNFTQKWQYLKDRIQDWKETKKGWRRHAWKKYMWKKWCHLSKSNDPENNEVKESVNPVEAISFRSLASGKNIGPQKGGVMDARRGSGAWGKFVVEKPNTSFSGLKKQEGEVFLIKSIPLGSYLRVTSDEQQLDCNGDGKSKECLFKFVPYTDDTGEICGHKGGLIIRLVHVVTNLKMAFSTEGKCMQPEEDDKTKCENTSLFELFHTVHTPHSKSKKCKVNDWEKKKKCFEKGCDWRNMKEEFFKRHCRGMKGWHGPHHGRHGPHHGRHGPHHGRHGPHHERHGPHHERHGPCHGRYGHRHGRHGPRHEWHRRNHGPPGWNEAPNVPNFQGWQKPMGDNHPNFSEVPRVNIVKIDMEEDGDVSPGQIITKTWTFCNTSSEAWSKKCGLVHLRGPNLELDGRDFLPMPREVKPGETVEMKMNLVAPDVIGRYITYWRLCDSEGEYFGPRVWASVSVSK